jgi:YVTN family beta-propeller protein
MVVLRLWALMIAVAVPVSAMANTVIVLNSDDDTMSVISGTDLKELSRGPIGRAPHHLMLTPDGQDLIIANAGGNELVFVDPATGAIRRRLPKISDPYQVGFSPDAKWFVTTSDRLDRVDIYNAADFSLAHRLSLPKMPSHIAFLPDSSRVFITLQATDSVAAIDLATGAVAWTQPVGPQPAGIWMTPAGTLVVGIMGSNHIAEIDPADGHAIRTIETGKGAHNFLAAPDGKALYVSNRVANTISVLDPATLAVTRTLVAPGGPDDMAFSAGGAELWATGRWRSQVDVIDLATGALKGTIPVGRSPHGIYIHDVPPQAAETDAPPAPAPDAP